MKNENFTKTLIRKTPGEDWYQIKNYEGMTEEEIIDACDNCNFGGRVYGDTVIVYTD